MNCKELDIKRVQNRLLEMGKVIADILERNNIPYMITFGTLLGAVRHGGFIPWDDDFDIFLFDDTYEKAMQIIEKNLPEDMFLETSKSEPLYFHSFAHVKDLKSEALCKHYPHDSIYAHKGLSIDLYKAVAMKESELEEFLLKENLAYLNRRKKINSISPEEYNRKVSIITQQLKNIVKNNSNKEIYGIALPERSMDLNYVLPLKKIRFEDTEFWGPGNPEGLLESFYGNYMQLPPEEKRIPHYDYVRFL